MSAWVGIAGMRVGIGVVGTRVGIGAVGTRVGSGVVGKSVGGGRVGLPTGAVRICMEGIVGMCLEIIRIPTGKVGLGASGVGIRIGGVGK